MTYRNHRFGIQLTAFALSAVLLCGCSSGELTTVKKDNDILSGNNSVEQVQEQNPSQETNASETKELSVPDLLKSVLTLKSDLESAMDALKERDPDTADQLLGPLTQKTDTVRYSLDATLTNLGDSMPSVRKQLENIRGILDLVDTLNVQIMQPAAAMLRENPLDELTNEEGFRVNTLSSYLDFAETLMPDVQQLVSQAGELDLSVVDSDGDLQEKLDKAEELAALYRDYPQAFTALKAMLGMEGDRTYLLAAQNSAEIRASGGFPGAMGVMRIQDGILSVDDFKKVYDMLSSYTPSDAHVTTQEGSLFHGGMSAPRDADYCPDFERVGQIWALGYEARHKENVDGVIAMTPVMVQRLLDVMDEEITLFDGMTMDGTNACRVLQYDMYYKYFGSNYVAKRGVLTDQLFADAAKKTMLLTFDHLNGKELSGYLDVASESLKDRTLMFWMKDETEQEIVRKLNWNGGLNSDPQKPEAGIYVNCIIASKMGIFLEMDTQMGERTKNEDGSYTYPITVTFHNNMTKDEIRNATVYITGGAGGSFSGSAYFFAPAGGKIGNFASENKIYIREANYHDLDLGFMQSLSIGAGKTLTITYDVTTAPGVETPLVFSTTPTIQDYR